MEDISWLARCTAARAALRSEACAAARPSSSAPTSPSRPLPSSSDPRTSSARARRRLTFPGSFPWGARCACSSALSALSCRSRTSDGVRASAGRAPAASARTSDRSAAAARGAESVAEFTKTRVIDPEVMGDLVQDGAPHLFPDLRLAPADRLDVLLVDGDLVRKGETVARIAAGERLPLVQPEQAAPPPGEPPRLERGREILHPDG